jgi:5-formyltetrahydrofolate cyclo-ligase
MGIECHLPIVPGRRRKKLWFTRLGDRPAWVLNRYGIPEYHAPPARKGRAYQLETLFMPCWGSMRGAGVSAWGAVTTMPALAGLARRRFLRKPRLIGVAFAAQQVDRIPRDPWDIPLDGVLTERGYLAIGRAVSSGSSDCG